MSVLLVEDDPLLRVMNHDLLEDAGFEVDSAEDGELGWQALRKKHYDLLVTDYDLPLLNGLQLIGRIRSQGLQLPVILASGSMELGVVADYPELRLSAILKKPVTIDDLVGTARSAVLVA
ncbi:MAG: response regulator [Verrucomicrobia bacterium]|nr:response regulator [Verrucomicrobiota bacterium]MBI3869392.1 response regulator [Verrucomicrobiota bacterium]